MFFLLLICLLFYPTSADSSDYQLDSQLIKFLEIVQHPSNQNPPSQQFFSPQSTDDLFAFQVYDGTEEEVEEIAKLAGLTILKKLRSFENTYIAKKTESESRRRKRSTVDIVQQLIRQRRGPSGVLWAEHLELRQREKKMPFEMRQRMLKQAHVKSSMKIDEVFMKGYSGKGTVVAVLDDGVDYHHEDLRHAYRPDLSYDFTRNREDPMPELNDPLPHGTLCVGVISMAIDGMCGVGIAYGAQYAGIKVLSIDHSSLHDAAEGESLVYGIDEVDIYSVSWGPSDDGIMVDEPRTLAQKAMQMGVNKGRKGLGALYVWASGNGGLQDDDCALDGYASNMLTLTFGVIAADGAPEYFSEGCPAVLASVDQGGTPGLITTQVGGGCTTITGSSAASPVASGILALTLEANPNLSHRDIRHLIVRTSNSEVPRKKNSTGWKKNGADFHFHRHFGFGILDASALVDTAKIWKNVGDEASCAKDVAQTGTFSGPAPLVIPIAFEACHGTTGEVNYVERIVVTMTVQHPIRGSMHIYLTSPMGTRVQLLKPRRNDEESVGLSNWNFLNLHHWGEKAQGTWLLEIESTSILPGTLTSARLTVHGTKESPSTVLDKRPRD